MIHSQWRSACWSVLRIECEDAAAPLFVFGRHLIRYVVVVGAVAEINYVRDGDPIP